MKKLEQTQLQSGETYTAPNVEIIETATENGFAKTGDIPDVPGEDF